MNRSLKEKLEQNIWITRKCRINASERLLSHARYIEILNVYYSIFVIILSLVSLTEQDNTLSIISLACSIALTISIIYANAAGYRERSLSLKQNYIELQLLLDQLSCIHDENKEIIMSISRQYAELLKSSENHMPIDLYQLKASGVDADMTLSKKEKYGYYKKRQEIQKMFPLYRKGEIDLILTQPLTTFSQTACNAINTIWELQALNIPVIYEKEGIKTCSPDAETLINLSAAFAKAESGPARKVACSISKPRTPAGFTNGSLFSICLE